jgi:hypothetical protein
MFPTRKNGTEWRLVPPTSVESSEQNAVLGFCARGGPSFGLTPFGALSVAVLYAYGCARPATPPLEYPPMEASAAVTSPAQMAGDSANVTPIVPGAPPIQIVSGQNTPLTGSNPTLHIETPRADQLIKSERIELSLVVKNWPMREHGNSILLFIDDAPAIPLHETHIDDLRGLLRAHQVELADGSHWLRVVASRPQHETVKLAEAHAVLPFHFKRRSEAFDANATAPWLGVAAPTGCVELGSRVLLDFYVANAQLGTSARVHYSLDDDALAGDIVDDAPHYIENLPAGDHSLRLRLRDAAGAVIASAHDSGVDVFHVASTCAPTAQPAATNPAQPPAASVAARSGGTQSAGGDAARAITSTPSASENTGAANRTTRTTPSEPAH